MSTEYKTIKFKEIDFNVIKKENSYLFFIDAVGIDFTRFFKSALNKYDSVSESDFNDSDGLGISLTGSVNCLAHIGSDYNIQEIDGKTGWERWIEDVSEEELAELRIKIVDYDTVYFDEKVDIGQLSDLEQKIINDYITSKFREGKLTAD